MFYEVVFYMHLLRFLRSTTWSNLQCRLIMRFLIYNQTKAFAVPRRNAVALILSSYFFSGVSLPDAAFAEPSVGLREYIDGGC
jgi:hypothetical protein